MAVTKVLHNYICSQNNCRITFKGTTEKAKYVNPTNSLQLNWL